MASWGKATQQWDTSKANRAKQPEMIAKLEWTQSNAQQNIEQLQNPTMGVTKKEQKQQKSTFAV